MDQLVAAVSPAALLALRASEGELAFIAALVPGDDEQRHLAQLRLLLDEQQGLLDESQLWYPYEVIECGARALQPGHEREFVLCTLVLLLAASNGIPISIDLAEHLTDRAGDYEELPADLRDAVLDAYMSAGY